MGTSACASHPYRLRMPLLVVGHGCPAHRRAIHRAPCWHTSPIGGRVQDAVRLLRRRLPRARIVLLGLLPVGVHALDARYALHQLPSPFSRGLSVANTQLRCGGKCEMPGSSLNAASEPPCGHATIHFSSS